MKRILIFLLFPLVLLAEEIVVQLHTDQETTQQVYLAQMRPMDTDHQKALYEALSFDFDHDVRVKLLPIDETKQFYAHHKDPEEAFQSSRWKKAGARFVVVPAILKDNLILKVFDVYTASLRTLHPIPLTDHLDTDTRAIHLASDAVFSLMFSKKGISSKRILYSYQPKLEPEKHGHWNSEIWEMGYDGKNKRQVTVENHYSITPTFFPSGVGNDDYRFLYVTYKQGQPRIYQSSKDNSRGTPLISLRGNQLLPTVSKQGDKVAFISDASGRADLFIQKFDLIKGVQGKPIQVFSLTGSVQASPTFSPDGNQVAFVSDKDGTPRIYTINLKEVLKEQKTPVPKMISKTYRDNSCPSWSEDGTKIAYSAKINGVRQLFVYDTETSVERQVTIGLGNKENPSWAPDSRHLVYNTTSPVFDIFLLDIDNPEPIRLTEGPGIKHYPAFER